MAKGLISVLGCGWLGAPLLRALVRAGYTVHGSGRRPETLRRITDYGGKAFTVDLPTTLPPGFIGGATSTLVITLPPRGRTFGAAATERYLADLAAIPELSTDEAPRVIYTSSTGVYGKATGPVNERTPPAPESHSARAVVAAEAYLLRTPAHLTVVRLAGLVATDRHPGRFFGGRERPIPQAESPVNLVHQDDVIAAIQLLLEHRQPSGEVFNVCAAAHPGKGGFYTAAAAALALEVAGTQAGGADGKRIDSTKLRALGWQPTWDDLDLARLR